LAEVAPPGRDEGESQFHGRDALLAGIRPRGDRAIRRRHQMDRNMKVFLHWKPLLGTPGTAGAAGSRVK
jgi:hypothetical protein